MAKSDAPKVKLRTVDKRVAGRRATETRDRILEALSTLLGSMSYRNVRVTDVVREVGTSPATFYQYFADVETAVLALAQDTAKESAGLKTAGAGARNAGAAVDQVIAAVAAYVKKNEALLRVIDTAAAEGDKRFAKVRQTVVGNAAAGLAVVGGKTKEVAGNADVLATLLLAGPSDAAAARRLVHWGLTGRKPTG
ncbi:TetR/AcrR family transcriptional regulator [Sporichthya polymorpha]|uniref:TetR/AcrR family transcriptional regulator n=1 Tax=Sporichthya polymorpha TaxID=35751 RepID=UPI00037E9418|nr:TetR family transcriptional regulator [Sporichthya polymorpha]